MPISVDGLGGQTSITATPAAITTTETVAHQLRLQPNEVQVGTVIRGKLRGTISATTAGTLLARLRLGTAGTTADTAVCATTAAGSATTAVGFAVEIDTTVRTIGASGTVLANGEAIVGATPILTTQTATIAVNTTVANWLSITLTGGGTSPSITITSGYFEIVKP